MPDHVHAIVWFPQTGRLSEFMKQWKRTSSLRIRQLFEDNLQQYAGFVAGSPVWQAKYYSFNLFSSNKFEEKLNYMHQNPVRAGLVRAPVRLAMELSTILRIRKIRGGESRMD